MGDETSKEKRKKNVIFYEDWYRLICKFDEHTQLKAFKAVFDYAFDGNESGDEITKAITGLMKSAIDRDTEKFIKTSERQRARQLKRWGKITQEEYDAMVGNKDTAVYRGIPVYTYKDKDKDKDKEYIVPKGTLCTDNISSSFQSEEISGGDELPHPTTSSKPVNFEEIREYWNETTKGAFGELRTLSEARRTSIRARIRETSKEDFFRMIDKAAESEFMHGQNSRGWQATFDWCIKPTNYAKVLDGNYDNPTLAKTTLGGASHDSSEGYKDYFDTEIKI